MLVSYQGDNPVIRRNYLRRILLTALAVATLLLFSVRPVFAAEKIVLQLRWDHQFQFAGYYAALWKGYYEKAGLDVEIRPGVLPDKTKLSATEEVSAGRADFGIGAADILEANDKGAGLVALSSIFQHSPITFYSLKRMRLQTPADLVLLRVGRRMGDVSDVEFQAMLRAEGIDPEYIRPYPPGFGVRSLPKGEADVVPDFSISAGWTAKEMGLELNALSPSSYGIDFYGDTIFARKDFVDQNTDLVARFLEATREGWHYALEKPGEMSRLIAQKFTRIFPIQDFEGFNNYQADVIKTLMNHPLVEVGNTNPERWRRMQQLMHQSGLVKSADLDTDVFIFDPDKAEGRQYVRMIKAAVVAGAVLLIIVLGFVIWTRMLRRTVTQRTAALVEREAGFRAVFDNAPAGIASLSPQGTLLQANSHFFAIFGLTSEQYDKLITIGACPVACEFLTALGQATHQITDENPVLKLEKDVNREDGAHLWISCSLTAVLGQDGSPQHYVAIMEDMTERIKADKELRHSREQLAEYSKNLEDKIAERTADLENSNTLLGDRLQELALARRESEERMHEAQAAKQQAESLARQLEEAFRTQSLVLENSVIGITLVRYHSFEWVNPKACEFAKLPQEELTGAPMVRMFSSVEDYKLIADEAFPVLSQGGTFDKTVYIKRPDNSEFWCRFVARALDSNHVHDGSIWLLDDVTERKTMEEELVKAKDAADEASKAKSDFLANMSHEIRTPMNAIMGMSHLALQSELTPKQQNYLEKIDNSAKALLRILNDILDFSKIEAGKLEMEIVDFNLNDVLTSLSDLINIKAEEKGLELLFRVAPDTPMGLQGDPLRLGQVLTNLANNAVKFTDQGEITVDVSPVHVSADSAELQFIVQDTGVGLTKEQAGRLFQAFTQADTSTTRKYGGTGLGLAISKRLVEMMDGDIHVESEAGAGSSFIFTAVFGRHDKVLSKAPKASLADDFQGMRVLIVDDNASALDILTEVLESMRFEVVRAQSGAEALEILQNTPSDAPFALTLMDWNMPGMDGVETARRIQESPSQGNTPTVIMVSAYSRDEIMPRAEAAGVQYFLPKPVSPSLMLDTLMEAFGRKEHIDTPAHVTRGHEADLVQAVRGAKILLVEDNEINQEVANELLVGAGLEVDIANNGREGVEAVRKGAYDLVLMDIQMPEMDGIEATSTIRADAQFQELPILAMTAHAMAGDREKSLEAGMDDHVTKPIDPVELFTALAKWIKPAPHLGGGPAGAGVPSVDAHDISFPESLPGIDIQNGLVRVGGNKKLYLNLLRKIRDKYATAVDDIRAHLDTGDVEAAQRLAHSIKGSAGNVGAEILQASAGGVEAALKQGQADSPDVFDATLSAFHTALQETLATLQTLDAPSSIKSDAVGHELGDESELAQMLDEMIPLLKRRKPKQCKEILARIKEKTWPAQYGGDIQRLGKLLAKYKFKDALPVVEQMLTHARGE